MGKDLFQISNERNIYQTMDLLAMLSLRLTRKEGDWSAANGNTYKNDQGTVEEAVIT